MWDCDIGGSGIALHSSIEREPALKSIRLTKGTAVHRLLLFSFWPIAIHLESVMRNFNTPSLLCMLALSAFNYNATAQTVLLYANDFSTPLTPPQPNCGRDLDNTPVNDLWQNTGTGTGGGGLWQQTFTVETILLNGPDEQYTDSSGIGGDYCIGMQNFQQNDLAGLTLNRGAFPYVNLEMDISALDIALCGGPFNLAQTSFRISAYNSTGGIFNITNPGTALDLVDVVGNGAGATSYSTNWAHITTGLDVSMATDPMVTVVLDLLTSNYAVLDNLEITASTLSLGISERSKQNGLRCWPNPATDVLSLDISNTSFQWTIFTNLGNVVDQGRNHGDSRLDIGDLAPGHYVIRCIDQDGVRTARFAKEY